MKVAAESFQMMQEELVAPTDAGTLKASSALRQVPTSLQSRTED